MVREAVRNLLPNDGVRSGEGSDSLLWGRDPLHETHRLYQQLFDVVLCGSYCSPTYR